MRVTMDLLTPLGAEQQMRQNYIHQLNETVGAYSPTYIFIGEALQNALDAVREVGSGDHHRVFGHTPPPFS